MKKIACILLACPLFFALLTGSLQAAQMLDKAVESGQAKIEVRGLGASSGDSLIIKAFNLSDQPLELDLPPGLVFKNISGGGQDMIALAVKGELVEEDKYRASSLIKLPDDQPREYLIEAYCLDFHRPNPEDDDRYALDSPDPAVGLILEKGRAGEHGIEVIQAAVWMYKGISNRQIEARFPIEAEGLAAAEKLVEETQAAMKGKLFVQTTPKDALVRILNIRPKFKQGIILDPGKYHIEVSAKGYKMHKEWISLGIGEEKTMEVSLKPGS